MTYSVSILRRAQAQLARIDRQDQDRVIDAVRALGENPRPQGCRKMSGRPAWRIRVGSYRVIYEIHDDRLLVLVITVGHRKDAYR
ncbi:MAG TPA: type II toxin-antitoxin system RelE/ParE family toxin [Candidatus Brocadiia bacterium]|nr:type II toxin-antitoxin system RelE/ParE family toxin [Candidatus Brocadiia bacterium]